MFDIKILYTGMLKSQRNELLIFPYVSDTPGLLFSLINLSKFYRINGFVVYVGYLCATINI